MIRYEKDEEAKKRRKEPQLEEVVEIKEDVETEDAKKLKKWK